MSAWYLMSALGLYAVDPVSARYVFGSPLFDRAEVQVAPGRKLTIEARNNAPGHPYIQSYTGMAGPTPKCGSAMPSLRKAGTSCLSSVPGRNPAYGSALQDQPI